MLEAMACGALVVGSRTAPVEEVIDDGINGRLVDFFDAAGLAGTLAEVLEQGAALDPLRRAARKTIEARFALKNCLQRQCDLIDEALSGRK